MLRGLRVLPRHPLVLGDAFRLSANGRGIFCRVHDPGAYPPASSSGSTAAIHGRLKALARPAPAGREHKRNSTGGFYEIPTDDRGGPGAGWHSKRDFAFG